MEKLDKDRRTLEAIGSIYCRGNHDAAKRDAAGMCPECREAIEQTLDRASSCPHGHEGNCQDCRTMLYEAGFTHLCKGDGTLVDLTPEYIAAHTH